MTKRKHISTRERALRSLEKAKKLENGSSKKVKFIRPGVSGDHLEGVTRWG